MLAPSKETLALFPFVDEDVREVPACAVVDLGLQEYWRSLELQGEIVRQRKCQEVSDHLLFVEYGHTITLGRSGKTEHLLVALSELESKSVSVCPTDRGGDITYHGPGQMIAYPILDLKELRRDIDWYLRSLESCIIETLADFGVRSARVAGATGVWVGDKKIAAIGVRTSRWVTSHGVALNVNTDLDYFGLIVPCGLPSRGVTSLSKVLGCRGPGLQDIKTQFCRHFGQIFGRFMQDVVVLEY
ncbi:MAG: lipoyl(octanoyl) transferase LipB [Acidobacteria bacterium]|nr:lipoyl(octanoyl) transferase LipB [Acidobacteriota bacterium]